MLSARVNGYVGVTHLASTVLTCFSVSVRSGGTTESLVFGFRLLQELGKGLVPFCGGII